MSPPKRAPKLGDTHSVERRIKAANISLGSFLRQADINPGLWWRWRHKETEPRAQTWARKVISTLERVERQRAAEAA